MNISLIYNYLNRYNEDELFYKDYYEASKSPEKLKAFLGKLDMKEIYRRALLLKERPETIPHYYSDDYFKVVDPAPRTVVLYKHNRYTPEFFHSHSFFEMFYVLSGSCAHQIKGQTSTLHEGDVCIIAPSTEHSIGVFDDSLVIDILIRKNTIGKIFFNLLRDKDILGTFFLNSLYTPGYSGYIIFHTLGDQEIRDDILEMYLEQFERDTYFDAIISNMLSIFLVRTIRRYKKTMDFSNRSETDSDAVTILNYINTEYEHASLDELAKKLGYTTTYCSSYIKKVTGFNFNTLLTSTRTRQAQYLLSNTDLSVESISAQLGYNNPENFMRAFKKSLGMSPSQYRRVSSTY